MTTEIRFDIKGRKLTDLDVAVEFATKTFEVPPPIMVQRLDDDGEGWTNVGLYLYDAGFGYSEVQFNYN